jgi:hypothetical protein
MNFKRLKEPIEFIQETLEYFKILFNGFSLGLRQINDVIK